MRLDNLMYRGYLTGLGFDKYWDTVSFGVTSYMSAQGRSLAYASDHPSYRHMYHPSMLRHLVPGSLLMYDNTAYSLRAPAMYMTSTYRNFGSELWIFLLRLIQEDLAHSARRPSFAKFDDILSSRELIVWWRR